MPTLFERVTGVNLDDSSERIGIHSIQSLMSEMRRGDVTYTEATSYLNLTESQKVDFMKVLTAAETATNELAFSSRVFNFLSLAEQGFDRCTKEVNFWNMINSEAAR